MCAFRLFGGGSFLDPEDEAWHLDTWKWLLENFGGLARVRHAPVVIATREFFPPSETKGHARAEHIFACIKRHAGMTDWPCSLVAQPGRPETRVAELGTVKIDSGTDPAGTFVMEGGQAVITYEPSIVEEPAKLVATLSHELAHYLLATAIGDPPGGHDMHEFATDLTTVFLGFGLFTANQAFNFSQYRDVYSQGWQSSRLGYLRERDWAFALAVFLSLRGQSTDVFKPLLKPHLYADMRKAVRYLERNPQMLMELRGESRSDG
jgi:hypothetical protein